MEGGLDSDYTDDSGLYYSQQSMFPPHRTDKDVSVTRPASGALIQAACGSCRTGDAVKAEQDVSHEKNEICLIFRVQAAVKSTYRLFFFTVQAEMFI